MEKIAIEEGVSVKECKPLAYEDLIKAGALEKETTEISQVQQIAFLHAKQRLYLIERRDGKGGQHFNLTQLPIESEIDPGMGLSLDYHVRIFFERPNMDYTMEKYLPKQIVNLSIWALISYHEWLNLSTFQVAKRKSKMENKSFGQGLISYISRTLR